MAGHVAFTHVHQFPFLGRGRLRNLNSKKLDMCLLPGLLPQWALENRPLQPPRVLALMASQRTPKILKILPRMILKFCIVYNFCFPWCNANLRYIEIMHLWPFVFVQDSSARPVATPSRAEGSQSSETGKDVSQQLGVAKTNPAPQPVRRVKRQEQNASISQSNLVRQRMGKPNFIFYNDPHMFQFN